jgi:hypothetical protein
MNLRSLIVFTFVLVPALAQAQDFGVMESAETINRGNFKLSGSPIIALGRDGAENDFGVAFRAGYGFTDKFDAEAKLGIFENLKFFGGDAEFWLVKNAPLDVSVAAGFHVGRSDVAPDRKGVDFTLLGSAPVASKLEVYGGLDFAFESLGDDVFDNKFTTVHLVPGIEYAVLPDLDFLAEFGIGLNDDSWHYFSAGLTFYIR